MINHKNGANKELINEFLKKDINVNVHIKTNINNYNSDLKEESIFSNALQSKDKWLLEQLLSKGITIGTAVPNNNGLAMHNSIKKLLELGINEIDIVLDFKKYHPNFTEQAKIDILESCIGTSAVAAYNAMDVNEVNNPVVATQTPIAAPTQASEVPDFVLNTEDKLSADIKKRLFNGESKDDVMMSLFSYDNVREDKIVELVDYISNYNHAVETTGNIHIDFLVLDGF
ncbi:MAG TPA: hypothetical protein LFW21_00200 [Rickettsia endosymbiont of Pyrocoelia pectoralis]|nr:hypothetical protein [Rickettsia endosymbiont of Pyrocoelia pectoralis]